MGRDAVNELIDEFDLELMYNIAPMGIRLLEQLKQDGAELQQPLGCSKAIPRAADEKTRRRAVRGTLRRDSESRTTLGPFSAACDAIDLVLHFRPRLRPCRASRTGAQRARSSRTDLKALLRTSVPSCSLNLA